MTATIEGYEIMNKKAGSVTVEPSAPSSPHVDTKPSFRSLVTELLALPADQQKLIIALLQANK